MPLKYRWHRTHFAIEQDIRFLVQGSWNSWRNYGHSNLAHSRKEFDFSFYLKRYVSVRRCRSGLLLSSGNCLLSHRSDSIQAGNAKLQSSPPVLLIAAGLQDQKCDDACCPESKARWQRPRTCARYAGRIPALLFYIINPGAGKVNDSPFLPGTLDEWLFDSWLDQTCLLILFIEPLQRINAQDSFAFHLRFAFVVIRPHDGQSGVANRSRIGF